MASAVETGRRRYRGTDTLIVGIVLAVITFWLFAQTTLNIAPAIRDSLAIAESLSNTAVSISALFSGIFIVVAGGLADRFGRVKLTNVGLALSARANQRCANHRYGKDRNEDSQDAACAPKPILDQ